MKLYDVEIVSSGRYNMQIEAETEKEAHQIAYDNADSMYNKTHQIEVYIHEIDEAELNQ